MVVHRCVLTGQATYTIFVSSTHYKLLTIVNCINKTHLILLIYQVVCLYPTMQHHLKHIVHMKPSFSQLLLLVCLSLLSFQLNAQQRRGPQQQGPQQRGTLVTGKVVDANSQQPVEFATIMIGNPETQQPITGATTSTDGTFKITTKATAFYVEVSFIGFDTKRIEGITIADGKASLGTIQLGANTQVLDAIEVRGEKSTTEFRLDKRVFNVGKDLSSTGAGALEVLNNVPSVNVSIEGEISLRGSAGVQVLINGKPSVLTSEQGNALGSITADMIDRIEVITNPGAKYDAEGTSGIINIVIKKEERKGSNGSLSVNGGVPDNYSLGFSINRRSEKFNLFTQLGVGYRELPNDTRNINRDLSTGTSIESIGEEFRNENFYTITLGTDYYINPNNVITVSGNFGYEVEDQPSTTRFTELDGQGVVLSEWERTEVTEATNPKYQYEVQYRRTYEDNEDHSLQFSALGSFFGKDQSSDFTDSAIRGLDNSGLQETASDWSEGRYTFKLDYTRPLSEQVTLETGAQYIINDVQNDFAVSDLVDGVWVPNDGLTNVFEWNQKVWGVYSTAGYENEQWGFKAGLRVEHTDLNTLLITTNQAGSQNYTNLFPSAHLSYKISKTHSIQAGYSRRIRRPRLWDLNPFFNIRNNFSIRAGNPDLLPEFTDSYEINSIYDFSKVSLNFGVYHRFTTDVIERISVFENNVNTFMPFNIGTNKTTGFEVNGKYNATDWLTINGDINYNYFSREGSLEGTIIDFSADQFTTKLTAKLKLPGGIDFETTTQYRSGFETVQGRISAMTFADIGLRKKIMKGKGVLNFSVRDLFASRIRESTTDQDDFFVYSRRLRGRFITLGFSFGFGKGEAMEYSGRRRRW